MTNELQPAPLGALRPNWTDSVVPEGYTVATVGDIIMTQPMAAHIRRHSPQLLDLLAHADLVVGNFEGTALDLRRFAGRPEAETGFSWLLSSPDVPADLKAMGFDLLSRANNHVTDWGIAGMEMTDELLLAAGLSIAGSGNSMAAARAPGLFFGERATASLVSWTSTFQRNSPAADPLGSVAGRAGASTLRTTPVALVSQEQWDQLRAIRDSQPSGSRPEILIDFDARMGFVTLFGQHYKVRGANDPAEVTIDYRVDPGDQAGILLNIRQAKQTSDFTIAAAHTHEPSNWTDEPPAFMRTLARQAIDSGADMVCCHGPHRLRGIEAYRGKPIFYSLANFSFTENSRAVMPREEWDNRMWRMVKNPVSLDPARMTVAEFEEWQRVNGVFGEDIWFESVIAVARFPASGIYPQIVLHPIEMGNDGRDAYRGIPRLASAQKGVEILSRLQILCRPLGTDIAIDKDNGIGTLVYREREGSGS